MWDFIVICTLYFMWDFIVRVVCERKCEDARQLKTKEVFMDSSREVFPRSEACAQHMTKIKES